jgi:hypothetical protein
MNHPPTEESGPQSLLEGINAQIPASDFEAEYFPGGMVQISMRLAAEMIEECQAVAAEQGWPEADALVALLGYGLGCLKEARAKELIERSDQPARDELDLMLKQMREMQTKYAVMKFRTWNYLQAFQSASLSRGALTNQATGLQAVVHRLRAENDELRREVKSLRLEPGQWQVQQDDVMNEPTPVAQTAPSLWQRLAGKARNDQT